MTLTPQDVSRAGTGARRWVTAALAVALLAGCGLVPHATEKAEPPAPERTPTLGPSAPPAEVPADVPAALAPYYGQELAWEPCGEGGFECTTIEVPLDYDRPEGETIELAVVRLLALNREDKIGSLVLNPGGPGGSGVEYARYAPLLLGEALRRNFDVVGFDPRGVGRSAPVTCLPDAQRDEFRAAEIPEDRSEEPELVELVEEFVDGCESRSGDLLPHVSTVDAARDMDVLRGVLGDEELHYLGMSYGTFLGATYADLFPDRVGRMVFDGAVDPSLSGLELSLAQANGFELALDAFLADCVRRRDCPLGDDPDRAYEELRALLARIDEHPLPTPDERELTRSLAETGVIMPLYLERLWPRLRQALAAALDGDGSGLLRLADEYAERGPDGYRSNAGEVIYAVNCLDRAELDSIDDARALEDEFVEASPLFGRSILWGSLPCALWPVDATGKAREIHAPGANPILVVGTTRDPATPYEWSVSLAEQLDEGVLLTRDGDGHTAYGTGNACVNDVVETFLLEGQLPPDGTVC